MPRGFRITQEMRDRADFHQIRLEQQSRREEFANNAINIKLSAVAKDAIYSGNLAEIDKAIREHRDAFRAGGMRLKMLKGRTYLQPLDKEIFTRLAESSRRELQNRIELLLKARKLASIKRN